MVRHPLPLLLLLGAGCAPDRPPESAGWAVVTESELTASQQHQRGRAEAARDALFGRPMTRLAAAVQAHGPAAAVAECQEAAPQIAQAVSAETGVRIGRTSDRLRNPNNRPPAWAESVVSARPDAPAYLAAADGRLRAVFPIRLKAQCLTCHGPPASIPPPVRDALAERYPGDQAVGYSEGDLRGWFWVEVPK